MTRDKLTWKILYASILQMWKPETRTEGDCPGSSVEADKRHTVLTLKEELPGGGVNPPPLTPPTPERPSPWFQDVCQKVLCYRRTGPTSSGPSQSLGQDCPAPRAKLGAGCPGWARVTSMPWPAPGPGCRASAPRAPTLVPDIAEHGKGLPRAC